MFQYGGQEGQIPDLLKIADLLEIADFLKIDDLPEIADLPEIVALPKIPDVPNFASQDRSLVCKFLIEPRFQRNGGKDRKATIRSQETEEQVGLSYRKYLNHIFIILRYFSSYPIYI